MPILLEGRRLRLSKVEPYVVGVCLTMEPYKMTLPVASFKAQTYANKGLLVLDGG